MKANLVIRPEKIGDLIVSLPAIRAFKESYPDEPLHLVTDPVSAELVQQDPHVDRIIAIPWTGQKKGQHLAWKDLYARLKPQSYQRAAILYPQCSGFNWLCVALGIRWVAQLGVTWPALLFHHKPILRRKFRNPKHMVEYYLDVVRLLGCKVTSSIPRLYLTDEEKQAFRARHPDYMRARKRILIHPFFVTAGANYSLEAYQQLALKLAERYVVKIYMVGTKNDLAEWQPYRHEQIDETFLGTLSLRETMVALSHADLLVGGASGMGHLAAALEIPTVSLYCPAHHHQVVWKPYGIRATCLIPNSEDCQKVPSCRLRRRGSEPCDLSLLISEQRVLEAVQECIEKTNHES